MPIPPYCPTLSRLRTIAWSLILGTIIYMPASARPVYAVERARQAVASAPSQHAAQEAGVLPSAFGYRGLGSPNMAVPAAHSHVRLAAGSALPTCRAATCYVCFWGVPADQEFVAFGPRDPLVVNLQRFSELPSLVSLGKSLEGVCHSPLPCCILHACLLRHGEARCSHASNSRPKIGT